MGTNGTKTSEWVFASLIPTIVALIIMALGVWKGNDAMIYAGLALLGLPNSAYAISRGIAKGGSSADAAVPATDAAAAAAVNAIGVVGKPS